MAIFEQYQPGQWRAAPDEPVLAFPVLDVNEAGGNRIIERDRPYRAGAKLDNTGSKAKRWTMRVAFENSLQEPGIDAVNGGVALYPDVLNALLDSFDRFPDETGDLSVPTRGWVRARMESYGRVEEFGERDYAVLTLTFVEDNEDRVDASSFTAPTVSANARRLSEVTTFDAQSDGIWDDDTRSLEETAADLEAVANAPGETQQEVDQKAGASIGSVNRVLKAFSEPGRGGRDKLRDPESSSTYRKLQATKEIAGRSRQEARRGRPPLVSVVFERRQSLVTVAAMFEQDFDDLLAVNPQIDDPLYIPPRTPVKVFGREQAA